MASMYDLELPEGYDPQVGVLLAALRDSTREWRENLEEPPVEAITWQPHEHGQSIGAQLLHLIDVEVYWLEEFAAGKKPPAEELKLLMGEAVKQDEGIWPTPPAEPVSWYFDLHDRIRSRVFESVRGIEPGRTYTGEQSSCTFRWILAHVVEHDSYHGGQAVLLHEMWKKR